MKVNYQEKPSSIRRPILKWAGGKTQLLSDIYPRIPKSYERYIEPFFGGGALYFSLAPSNSIIADSNPELINLYTTVADNVDELITSLYEHKNNQEYFYDIRSKKYEDLTSIEAASRTLYLNKTCFNGLYRVNKKGEFNTPFANYKNPNIVNKDVLRLASIHLKDTKILCGDYKKILQEEAQEGDFVFLDPPYLPISKYADFKRYTKEQFYEEDHLELSTEVKRLHNLGCHVILTNSNHPIVHEQYKSFGIDVIQTKRFISCNGSKRKGEDVIVNIPPKKRFDLTLVPPPLDEQVFLYPSTRFMGSKNKLLQEIWSVASQFDFDSVIDLFSGSGVVSYMFKSYGKQVISNDYMSMSASFTKAMIENNSIILPLDEARKLLDSIAITDTFVQDTFKDLYYKDKDNELIDLLRFKIKKIRNPYKRAIAMSALIRACLKKRPRGIFTYVGHRYDDGRKDLKMSFHEQFLEAVNTINLSIFDNGHSNKSRCGDAMTMQAKSGHLVYIDPPYYSRYSDNEYVRRYHFVEGLAKDWKNVEMQEHTKTKKFKSYPTPFSTRKGAHDAFDKLFKKYRNNILLVSYSSNSEPTRDEMVSLMSKYKQHVEVIPIKYQYSFGNRRKKTGSNNNSVSEYLFVGY
ncbi:MAG: Dam family site-specific DNA-(adenine-N6)-methyltransferase [Cocleimonas sp.]|nr:Dam family site-specific DNA-(adenine-N6)-methyltransferase [Cocleimonas sp.]